MHPPVNHDVTPSRRGRRRLRTALTLLILAGLVAGAAWYSWDLVTEPTADTDDEIVVSTPECAMPVPTDAPPPEEINLNIYNGTSINGLASQVARTLREQGYVILDVANDPRRRSVTGVAEIRAASQRTEVELVMSQFPGAVFLQDQRQDDSIDVVVGQSFQQVGPQAGPGSGSTGTPSPDGTATPDSKGTGTPSPGSTETPSVVPSYPPC